MNTSIFLSYPRPYLKVQQDFIDKITDYLTSRGLNHITLGVTNYDMDAPLVGIRRLMEKSNGLLAIALRRGYIVEGKTKPDSNLGQASVDLSKQWITSPYCQIEPAMAFQLGLLILILKERGVIADGVLEKGVTGTYLPEFDLDRPFDEYLNSEEWKQLIGEWVRRVILFDEKKKTSSGFF